MEILQLLLLFWLLLSGSLAQPYIYVHPTGGVGNTSCWYGGQDRPCSTLDLALEGVQATSNSTWHPWIILKEGNYTLQNTSNGVFTGPEIADFGMVADESSEKNFPLVTVTCGCESDCDQSTGFRFVNVSNITIKGVWFFQCGMLQNSTSCDTSTGCTKNLEFQAGLYFILCMDIFFDRVWVTNSPGIAVVIYSSAGENTFQYCNFSNNKVDNSDVDLGGGGLYLEFSYCLPEVEGTLVRGNCYDDPNVSDYDNSNATYLFSDCYFTDNHATVVDEINQTFILPRKEYHTAFGRGGGLSIFFKGRAAKNDVTVINCHFLRNKALWGGGLFVEFQDDSTENTLRVLSSFFSSNKVSNSSETEGTGGGGVRLGFLYFGDTHVSHNRMLFDNCNFTENVAYWGGGVSFYTAREQNTSNATNTLEFSNCYWSSNEARLGDAVDLSVWHPVSDGVTVQVSFKNITVECHGERAQKSGSLVDMGTMYIDSIPTTFDGYINFVSNMHTALAAIAASIDFLDNCVANFTHNYGRNGGAVAVFGYAFIRVHGNAQLNFIDNSASLKGGAIFAKSVGEHDLLSSRNCFVRFNNISVTPSEWTATFYFENNTADGEPNAIYTTTTLQCLWGGAYGPSSIPDDTTNVLPFCRDNWNYSGSNCEDQIATAPGKFSSSSNYHIEIFPGQRKSLSITMSDDFDRNATDSMVLTAQVKCNIDDDTCPANDTVYATVDSTSKYISDNTIKLLGNPSETVTIALYTIDPRVVYTEVYAELLSCPPGFVLDNDSSNSTQCKCGKGYAGRVNCTQESFSSSLALSGYWMGCVSINGSNHTVVGDTPYTSTLQDHHLQLPSNSDCTDLSEYLCEDSNRSGVLCGECISDNGPVINSPFYYCAYCLDVKSYSWALFILTELFPIAILFFILVLFNISLTSGPANAFIFFAQAITSYLFLYTSYRPDFKLLQDIYVVLYDISNLNFFDPISVFHYCIWPEMKSIDLIALEYIAAVFPLVLILLLYSVIWLYNRGISPIVCMCRPVHYCLARLRSRWNLQRSMADAFAAFLLLSYTKFTIISFRLLHPTYLYDDSGHTVETRLHWDGTIMVCSSEHAPYIALAVFVLVVFIFLPSALLLLYPFRAFHACIRLITCGRFELTGGKLQLFLNAFYGCFKDGTEPGTHDWRCFAGLYFILRIAWVVLSFIEWEEVQYLIQQILCIVAILLFAMARPYKRELYNKVDTAIFGILATITALSYYNYILDFHSDKTSYLVFYIEYVLIWLPLVYLVLFLSHHFWVSYLVQCKKDPPPETEETNTHIHDNSIIQLMDERSSAHSQQKDSSVQNDLSWKEGAPLLNRNPYTGSSGSNTSMQRSTCDRYGTGMLRPSPASNTSQLNTQL